MRLGIDSDGVVLDNSLAWSLHMSLCEHPNGVQGRPVSTAPPTWWYYGDLCIDCFEGCCMSPEVLKRAELMPDAKDALRGLSREHELYLISHRDESLVPTLISVYQDLGINEFFTSLIVYMGSKRRTCEDLNLDMMLDDNPAVIEDLRPSSVLSVIFSHEYNADVPGKRVGGWPDFVRYVSDMSHLRLDPLTARGDDTP